MEVGVRRNLASLNMIIIPTGDSRYDHIWVSNDRWLRPGLKSFVSVFK